MKKIHIKGKCEAPGCTETGSCDVTIWYLILCFLKIRVTPTMCPEHKERITSGTYDDGNPNTNPDLEKDRVKQVD